MLTTLSAGDKSVLLRRSHELKQGADGYLLVQQNHVESNRESKTGWLWSINRDYAFELHRRDREKTWAVSQIDTNLEDGVSFDQGAPLPVRDVVRVFLEYPVSIGWDRLVNLTKDESFKVLEINTPEENKRKIEFEIQNGHPSPDKPIQVKEGWLLIDEHRQCVLLAYEVKMLHWAGPKANPAMKKWAGHLEYHEKGEKCPLIKTVTVNKGSWGKSAVTEDVLEFTFNEGLSPSSAFRLSAYGFAEPEGLVRPTPWFVWGALVAVGIIVLAIAISKWFPRNKG